jgi:hypothetical protein
MVSLFDSSRSFVPKRHCLAADVLTAFENESLEPARYDLLERRRASRAERLEMAYLGHWTWTPTLAPLRVWVMHVGKVFAFLLLLLPQVGLCTCKWQYSGGRL